MSCLKGSTVYTSRILFPPSSPYRQVPVGDSAMFLCLKTHCQCESQTGSPELSAGCGSPECHVPYIIQNQYLTSCSPQTLWHCENTERERGCNLRASEEPEPSHCSPPPPPSSFLSSLLLHTAFFLLFWSKFSCLVHADPLGLQWFSAECGIKSTNFIKLSLSNSLSSFLSLFLCVCECVC